MYTKCRKRMLLLSQTLKNGSKAYFKKLWYAFSMTTKTWLSVSILIVIAAICAIIIHSVRSSPGKDLSPVACTMDAKMCPDGSAVGRTGPKCEFAACPTPVTPSTSSTKTPTKSTTVPTTGGVVKDEGFAPYKSGVNGVVTLNGKAYQTTVTVFRSTDTTRAYALTQTDQNGLYAFNLPPGSYILGAGETNSPQCARPEVSIGTASIVTANIACK